MNQLFKLQNEKDWKTLLLTNDQLMLVNKLYNSTEEFTEKFNEKGLLKQRLEIALPDISKITYPEKNTSIATISFPKNNTTATLTLEFANDAEQAEFVRTVIQPRKMTASTAQVSILKAIGSGLLGLFITAAFTFATYQDARITEAGGTVNTSGRRTLYKQLFAWLGETLGTQGTLIAGTAIGLFFVFLIFKNMRRKPVEIVYE